MTASLRTAIVVGVLSLVAYLATLCPTIFVGDCGELATVAWGWGIAHPPGYPLWVLLGHLASLVTAGHPALGTNLLSAICAAGANALLAATLVRMGVRPVLAAAAALGYGFAPTAWSQALITEVYSLNQLMVAGLLFTWTAARRREAWALPFAAYLFGLGLANHPLVALAVVPFLFLPAGDLVSRLPAKAGFFLLGVSTYLLTFLRGLHGSGVEWASPHSATDVLDHILRLQYAGGSSSDPLLPRMRLILDVWRDDATAVALVLALVGLGFLARRQLRTALGWGAMLLAAGPGLGLVIGYENSFSAHTVMRVFFLTSVMAIYALAAVGLENLVASTKRGARLAWPVAILALVAVGVRAATEWSHADRRESTLARDYATTVLDALPQHSRIYALGDNEVFSLVYAQTVLGVRPDVEVLDASLNLFVSRYGEDFPQLDRSQRRVRREEREIEFALRERDRPIFYTSRIQVDKFTGCRLDPVGMVYQLLRPAEAAVDLPAELDPMPPVDADDALECTLAAGISYRGGLTALEEGDPATARHRLARAEDYGQNLLTVQRALGSAYQELGDRDAARRCLQRALALDGDDETTLYALAALDPGPAATPYLEHLVALGSQDVPVRLLLAVERVREGDLSRAAAIARQAQRLDPDFAPTRQLLDLLDQAGVTPKRSLAEVQREVEGLQTAWTVDVARAQLRAQEFERAIATFRGVLNRGGEDPTVLRSLGFALLQAQRLDEAADVFAKLVRLRPTDADAANALAYTYAIAGDSLQTATRLAERAMRDSSALRPYALDTLGWIQYRQGRLDAALAALTEAASTLPSSDEGMLAENAYHQAWVLMELGRTEEARAAAERSRQDAAHRFWERDLRALESRLGIGPRS